MTTGAKHTAPVNMEPERRLSPWRVLLALFALTGLVAAGMFGLDRWHEAKSIESNEPWFASYVDVTAKPTYGFEQASPNINQDVVLSFVVSLPTDPCTPAWGGAYTLDKAAGSLDLDRRIARLQQQGGNIAVSFGGLLNDELALKCADEAKLKAAYKAVIERYDLDTIDLDIEQDELADKVSSARRAKVIAELQAERRAQGKKLAVWLTVPVAPQGMAQSGTDAVADMLAGGVDLAGVNVMTMDYGQSRTEGQSMLEASKSALTQAHRQLGVLYQRANTPLSSGTLWSKIGATPMIGQNDFADEVFTLDDAKGLNEFARSHGVGRMSMWSANRDRVCGSNYVDVKVVSDSCSGVQQNQYDFTVALSVGFNGSLSRSAGTVTTADSTQAELPKDDPATSPYQIWSESGAYLAGTKVVWHRNVYQAKWWTQGDVPDNPVLQSWETPWELIGPVLPGEKPIPQATLPDGTYPEWSGTVEYDTGQRVLFKGVPYQAKWWNMGESPAAASSNADSSPWAPLTQAQINEVEAQLKKSGS